MQSPTNEVTPAIKPLSTGRIILGVTFIVCLVLIALLCPIPFIGRSASALGDLVHAPLFGSLALGWLWAWQRVRPLAGLDQAPRPHQGRRLIRRGLLVWAALSCFGVFMEYLQSGMGRSMSRHDAISNSLGIAAAISLYTAWWFWKRDRKRPAVLFLVVSICVLAGGWTYPVRVFWDISRMSKQFPMLASFESGPELTRWYFRDFPYRMVQSDVSDGSHALEVDFPPVDYAGITLVDMIHNWSDVNALEFDMTLASEHPFETETVLIQIVDGPSKRGPGISFRRVSEIRRGETKRLRFPIDSFVADDPTVKLNASQIVYLDIAIDAVKTPTKVTLDRVILVLKEQ